MDINDCDFEEYIFIGEMIVRKMQEEESYNEFGWRPVAALIDAYTRDTISNVHLNFARCTASVCTRISETTQR